MTILARSISLWKDPGPGWYTPADYMSLNWVLDNIGIRKLFSQWLTGLYPQASSEATGGESLSRFMCLSIHPCQAMNGLYAQLYKSKIELYHSMWPVDILLRLLSLGADQRYRHLSQNVSWFLTWPIAADSSSKGTAGLIENGMVSDIFLSFGRFHNGSTVLNVPRNSSEAQGSSSLMECHVPGIRIFYTTDPYKLFWFSKKDHSPALP